MTFCTIAS